METSESKKNLHELDRLATGGNYLLYQLNKLIFNSFSQKSWKLGSNCLGEDDHVRKTREFMMSEREVD